MDVHIELSKINNLAIINSIAYRPLRELSTAFSMNSMMVLDLNLAHEPNENVP